MAGTRIVLKVKGLRAILRGPEVMADLERRANAIAAAAGDGFVADSSTGSVRGRASVYTETREAMAAEARDRALTRALSAGRR